MRASPSSGVDRAAQRRSTVRVLRSLKDAGAAHGIRCGFVLGVRRSLQSLRFGQRDDLGGGIASLTPAGNCAQAASAASGGSGMRAAGLDRIELARQQHDERRRDGLIRPAIRAASSPAPK